MGLTEELKNFLLGQGAALAGIGDMGGLDARGFRAGAAIAIPLPKDVIASLQASPTREYYRVYHSTNRKLNEIVLAGEDFLRERGFDAYAQTTDRVTVDPAHCSRLPHKTVAARAGLGWIGKNNLLVTPQYGPAVRLSSLLSNAPLEFDAPIRQSLCGACRLCVAGCPAQALTGTLWEAGIPRERMVDVEKCRRKQVEIMYSATGIETDLCGKCFAVCAYTQKYLKAP